MMDPARKSVAVGYAAHINLKWYSAWTQMTSNNDPPADVQDCGLNDDGTMDFAPTEPPSTFPTTIEYAGNFLDFEINQFEMELLMHLNQARKDGNQEECYGEFYQDLPPMEWNRGLFRAARKQVQDISDGLTNWGRTGPDGLSFQDRVNA